MKQNQISSNNKDTKSSPVLIYSTALEAKTRLLEAIQDLTDNPIVIAQTLDDIFGSVVRYGSISVLLFIPHNAEFAARIRDSLRALSKDCWVKIIPSSGGTSEMASGWQRIVGKAIRAQGVKRATAGVI